MSSVTKKVMDAMPLFGDCIKIDSNLSTSLIDFVFSFPQYIDDMSPESLVLLDQLLEAIDHRNTTSYLIFKLLKKAEEQRAKELTEKLGAAE